MRGQDRWVCTVDNSSSSSPKETGAAIADSKNEAMSARELCPSTRAKSLRRGDTPAAALVPCDVTRIKTAVTVDRPAEGLQFATVVQCKYYGSAVAEVNDEEVSTLQHSQLSSLIAQVIHRNQKQHVSTELRVTDRGCTVTDVGLGGDVLVDLSADQILSIVPGTLRSKSGKMFTVAIMIITAK